MSIPWFSKAGFSAGRVGIAVGPDGLAIAYINEREQLEFYQFYADPGDSSYLLEQLVESQGWQGKRCSLVLHPAYYQLLLAESPSVQDSEMSEAVRWKVKELLDFPIEEAAVEHFKLPGDAYRGRQKMLYAAAMQKSSLKSLVTPVEESGLEVDCVEIAELALHNIVSRLPADTGGTAVIQLYENEGFINLIEEGDIYLCRRLDIGLEAYQPDGDNQSFYDSLLLEIQRSLDYYESQLGKGIITSVYFTPVLAQMLQIGEYIASQLGLKVSALPLTELELMSELDRGDEELNRCVSAIGAAMQPPAEVASAAAS